MLKDRLIKILSEYEKAKQELFKNHLVANFIRNESLIEIKKLANNTSYKIAGHPGMGNWANIAWLEIRNPLLAETAQEGIYITYLFKSNCSGVYLSLQHGITKLKNEKGKNYIIQYLPLIREKIKPIFSDVSGWQFGYIQLGENVDYELSNLASKYYSLDDLRNLENHKLENDLLSLLDIYKKIPEDFIPLNYTIDKEESNIQEIRLNFPQNMQIIPKPFLIL